MNIMNVKNGNSIKIDEMVLEVQKWVNLTYEEALIESGWGLVIENGKTSWDVINGLIIGLQVELGIQYPAPSFRPGTIAAMDAYGSISEGVNDSNLNINKIIQGGCWCTGYNQTNFDGVFDQNLTIAMKELENDIGIEKTGIVDTKLMKALLTMNAYVVILDGNEKTRSFQQWLNRTYKEKQQFYYIPCDGLYSRGTQEGIIYGIQFECGLDDVANGWFGPTTQANLKEKGLVQLNDSDSTYNFVHLFKGAFICNNKNSNIIFNGTFGQTLFSEVMSFQKFMCLEENGKGDFQTWCDLLVSTGDSSRKTKALDCSLQKVTEERADYFKSQGYETIGRYITNEGGTLDKELEQYEIDNIFSRGMYIFPIYQTYGHLAEHFTYENGYNDAKKAINIAKMKYGIPTGTTIYFPVDYDAYQYEVESSIKSYFEGVNAAFGSYNGYYIGIYGARNTCSIISNYGLAKYSFVSGMSIGFSGNLGYPMPSNWSFNQIYEDYELGIDNDVKSGRDNGFSKQEFVSINNVTLYSQMLWIYQYALYYAGQDVESANKLLVDVYRVEGSYDDLFWQFLFGTVDKEFCNEVNIMLIDRGEELITTYTDPKTNDEIGLLHCVGTFAAYYSKGTDFNNSLYLGDIGGWLGDFVTLMADYTAYGRATGLSTKEYVELYCGSKTNLTNNTYPYEDYVADTDGYNLAKLSNDFDYNFISAFAEYFMLSTMSYNRYNLFFEWRQNNEQAVMRSLIEQTVDTSFTSPIMAAAIIGLYELQLRNYETIGVWLTDFNKEERAGLVDGYINIQNQLIQSNEK